VTLPAADIDVSVAFYEGMGFTLIVLSPHYARFECPEGDATFSVHLSTEPSDPTGVVVYFECSDLDVRVGELQARGYLFSKPPTDERWLWREARLQDPSGNILCLFWAGQNRKNPPWRVPQAAHQRAQAESAQLHKAEMVSGTISSRASLER
jgi:predicted enzyme related to lactoylglutathione lyase